MVKIFYNLQYSNPTHLLSNLSLLSGTYLDIPREELEAKYAKGSSQFLDLPNGARIHFRDEGKPESPAIVLLHGFNGSLFRSSGR